MRMHTRIGSTELEYEVEVTKVPGYYTVAEAAERLEVSPGRVRQLIADGTLASIKVGATRLIPDEAIEIHERTRRGRGKPPLTGDDS